MYIINTITHGKCFVRYLRTRFFCIRNLTRSLRSLVRFLIRQQLVRKYRTPALSMKYSLSIGVIFPMSDRKSILNDTSNCSEVHVPSLIVGIWHRSEKLRWNIRYIKREDDSITRIKAVRNLLRSDVFWSVFACCVKTEEHLANLANCSMVNYNCLISYRAGDWHYRFFLVFLNFGFNFVFKFEGKVKVIACS